jgi:hypothetical protein
VLLPKQNKFTITTRDFHLQSLPPEKPAMERIDADTFTKLKIGLIRDTAEAKIMKDGRRIVRAGNYAYLRLCPSSLRKTYDLIDSLGSVVAERDVIFLDDYQSHQQRHQTAVRMIRTYKVETENIIDTNRQYQQIWERLRKQWETELVYRVWDEDLGQFPPYVTHRAQLGDTHMDIPEEWKEKPHWQSQHYCAICLEPMPLICHVCREDINEQQAEEQARRAEEDRNARNAAAAALADAIAAAAVQAPPEVADDQDQVIAGVHDEQASATTPKENETTQGNPLGDATRSQSDVPAPFLSPSAGATVEGPASGSATHEDQHAYMGDMEMD